jgi:ABC-type bacteriocin/lantibiotic exporter with double-glycine peptidase domain
MIRDIFFIFNKKIRFESILIFFLLVIATIIEILSIGITLPILNFFLSNDAENNNFLFLNKLTKYFDINYLLVFFVLLFILKNILSGFISWKQNSFLADIKDFLTNNFITGYLNMSYSNYKKEKSSDLIRNLINETNNFSGVLQNYFNLILEFFIIFSITSLLLIFNAKLTLVIFCFFFIVAFIYLLIFRSFLQKIGNQSVFFSSEVIKDIQNCFLNFKIIKLLNNPKIYVDNFNSKNRKLINSIRFFTFIQSLTKLWLETLIIISFISILFLMKNKALNIDLVTVGFFLIASLRIMPSVNKIINYLQKLKYSKATITLILKEYNKLNLINFITNNNEIKKNNYKINFNDYVTLKNLEFFYDKNNKIFYNFNLVIKNNILLISGKSGSGKTTLIELICGLLKPTSGQIFIGENEIDQSLKEWQSQIAYVPQKTHLLDSSIKKNVLFENSEENFNQQKFNLVLELCKLKDFVNDLENKEDTIISEQAMNISGGQAQRIGIARALYQESKILIFDEAFNALDYNLAKEIIINIKKNFTNKKIIIISHESFLNEIADQKLNLDLV